MKASWIRPTQIGADVSVSMSGAEGEVVIVGQASKLKHERLLLKQLVLISSEDELMQGPLDQPPLKQIDVPDFTGAKTKDDSGLAYTMIRRDLQGEKRVSAYGQLREGRTWLFNTLRFPNSEYWFVLLIDLVKCLQYEGDEVSFLNRYDQLLALEATDDQKLFLKEKGLLKEPLPESVKYFTTKSAFVQFGAAVLLGGIRVLDDYWESLAREKSLTPHHRVFKLSPKLIADLKRLKPSLFLQQSSHEEERHLKGNYFEQPYLTVTEQASAEVRDEYGKQFAEGQHIGAVIPGQSINGSLELSAQFKLPKYHSKNSFQHAAQMNALDVAIEMPQDQTASGNSATPPAAANTEFPSSLGSFSNKSAGKRLLSSISDTNISNSKGRKSEEHEILSATTGSVSANSQLNISGWKFESLPLRVDGSEPEFSVRGLPFYDKNKLLERLKILSPNQVKELEHLHDGVFLNTGLQNVRKIRSAKWTKYWQYKTGLPVGLLESDLNTFRNQYLAEVLSQKSTTTKYNDATLIDEVQITSRIPNANFLGNSNIKGFRPPYALPVRKDLKR